MGYESAPLENIPAPSAEWDAHVRKVAETRVFTLVGLYNDDPDVFRRAFKFREPRTAQPISFEMAAWALFTFCCAIVARDWTWQVKINSDKTQEVRVVRFEE